MRDKSEKQLWLWLPQFHSLAAVHQLFKYSDAGLYDMCFCTGMGGGGGGVVMLPICQSTQPTYTAAVHICTRHPPLRLHRLDLRLPQTILTVVKRV